MRPVDVGPGPVGLVRCDTCSRQVWLVGGEPISPELAGEIEKMLHVGHTPE
jgi:hypothetical protein